MEDVITTQAFLTTYHPTLHSFSFTFCEVESLARESVWLWFWGVVFLFDCLPCFPLLSPLVCCCCCSTGPQSRCMTSSLKSCSSSPRPRRQTRPPPRVRRAGKGERRARPLLQPWRQVSVRLYVTNTMIWDQSSVAEPWILHAAAAAGDHRGNDTDLSGAYSNDTF